jgi:predicted transglutaminase-like cysteine proteinase
VVSASQWRAVARIIAILCVVAPCGSAVTARPIPDAEAAAQSAPSAPWRAPVSPGAHGPFGLVESNDNPLTARWRGMRAALALEERILSMCETNPSVCPPAAARFLALLESARGSESRALVGRINRAVNLAIRPVSDSDQYGVSDLWATPLMTFAREAGDCEDYAIAKYVALRRAGMAEGDLRIVILHNGPINQDHAVTAARVDGQWLILDNRPMLVLTDAAVAQTMTPLLALDSGDERPAIVVAARQLAAHARSSE